MQPLAEFQKGFAAAVLEPPGSRGMAVYRANAFGNWSKALAGAYPVARKIVGEAFFEALAREYARACPSTNGDLNEYGEHLADFLTGFAHTQDLPYLPDVARMEWLVHRAHFAADATPFDMNTLRAIAAERHGAIRLMLAASCALLASDWPLARIWAVHQDDRHGEPEVDLCAGPDNIVVHRPRWRVEVTSATRGDFRFLQAARAGNALEVALESAAREDPGFDASRALAVWVQAGVIVGVCL